MTRLTQMGTIALALTVLLTGCASAEPGATALPSLNSTPAPAAIDDSPLEDQLLAAINNQDVALIGSLVEAGADLEHDYGNAMRPLHLAVNAGYGDVVRELIALGADVEAPLSGGETPLLQAARFDEPDVARALMEAGADMAVFTSDQYNESPLLRATRLDNADVVLAMLEAGADIEVAGEMYNATPLATAAFWGAPRSAEVLILFGADVTVVDEDGITLLGTARANGHDSVVALLEAVNAPE